MLQASESVVSQFETDGTAHGKPLSPWSAAFSHVSLPSESLNLSGNAQTDRFSDVSNIRHLLGEHWTDDAYGPYRQLTIGYAWRGLQFESSTISASAQPQARPDPEGMKLTGASRRLSFSPSANWTFRLGRGFVSNLDQLRADEQIRRTALAATYLHALDGGDWQTTFAWGRSVRRFRDSNTGYLLESTLRLQQAHSFFGRVEQIGSDELFRDNGSMQGRDFKLNRLTVGYFHDVRFNESVRFDVGGLISKNLVPGDMATLYSNNPTSLMMFLRLKLR